MITCRVLTRLCGLGLVGCWLWAQAERSSVDAYGNTETVDTNATYDAPLREKVHTLIDSFRDSGGMSPSNTERDDLAKDASAGGPDAMVSGGG